MKNRIYLAVTLLCLAACSTRTKITQAKIHKNTRFRQSFSIYKLSVNHFNPAQIPVNFIYDSVFHCRYAGDFEPEEVVSILKGPVKEQFQNLMRIRDSIKAAGQPQYRGVDTIEVYGTHYIAAGIKQPLLFYETEVRMEHLKYTRLKNRVRKTVLFQKPNKFYRWRVYPHGNRATEQKVDGFCLVPQTWYLLSLDYNFGLLQSGRRSFYFAVNQTGELTMLHKDYERGGSF
jgi:hypothetical protein